MSFSLSLSVCVCVDVLFKGFLHASYCPCMGLFVYRDVSGAKEGFMKSCKWKDFPNFTKAFQLQLELHKIVTGVLRLMI